MLTGQIGLLRFSTGWIGKAIEWATDSHTHHVIVAVSETECVSADLGGVRFKPISDFGHVDWSAFVLTGDQVKKIIAAARFYVDRPTPYNLAIYPPLLWQKLTGHKVDGWLAKWLSKRPNENCSQLADDIYNRAGIHLFPDIPEIVTPGDFERYFKAKGWL
ncbi:hypothetical protein AB6813_04895 [bacterium RCC_150]